MDDSSRFIDNNDGSILDNKTGLLWTKEDSWQTDAKWVSWDEANEQGKHLCYLKFCGYQDWRLPTTAEALTLYDPEAVNTNKYGKEMHLPSIFPAGGLSTIWLVEFTGNDGSILDFANGEVRPLYMSKSGRMAARLVRKNPE
jgi:hypothetical protein